MLVDAVIMAGGRSVRMRKRGDPTHKALVCLDGIPMAERSLATLIAHGFRSVGISVSERESDVLRFARGRLSALAASTGASLHCIVEAEPLGTIGAVGRIVMATDALLVVNVDNVTALDLRQLVEGHRSSGAAMTIAAHWEPFPMPFGELEIRDGAVRAYREKPTHHICVSSGTYVLSADAVRAIKPNERIGVPELFERLRARSLLVAAHQHKAAWIDVNDAAALARAERLVCRQDDSLVPDAIHR